MAKAEYWRSIRDPMFDLPHYPPKVVVEIGSFRGAWAWRALEQLPGIDLFCVDPWEETSERESSASEEIFCEWLEMHHNRLGRRIWPFRMKSVEAALKFPDNSVDLIFVDGMHLYDVVLQDLMSWWPKLRPEGLMVLDNGWGRESIREAVTHFTRVHGIERHTGTAMFKTAKRESRKDVWMYKESGRSRIRNPWGDE